MARYTGYKRPKDTRRALRELLRYMGYHRWLMLLVAVLVCISTGASVTGTYLLKPVINDYILPGDVRGLILALFFMGGMYLCGALSTFWYNRLMVKTSQKVVGDIRRDLFAHVQTLPLKYFDANTHGELMSRFTNDVDTIQEALNNSFTMVIQSALTLTGTVVMLIVLNVRMALIVIVFLLVMFWFIKWNGKRSKEYFDRQQTCLADINGFTEEMVAGQKVEKIFNHEEEDMKVFREHGVDKGACLFFHDDPLHRQPVLRMLCGVSLRGRAPCHCRDDGPWKPGGLSGLRAPERHAAQSVYPAGELHPVGTGRRGTHFRNDARGAGTR